jgi:endonuclease I
VNGNRSNHPFGHLVGEERTYGSRNFEIGPADAGKIAEPSELSNRTIGCPMLYMGEEYGVNVRLSFDPLWQ